jgi:hypothetical protein
VGYTTQTFNSTILGTTAGTWQNFNFFGRTQPEGFAVESPDGGISLKGTSGDDYNAGICTAAQNSGYPEHWNGVAFGGGFYVEAEISFTGTPPGYPVSGWPSFWALDIEHLSEAANAQWTGEANGYDDWIETDFMEANLASGNEYGLAMHNWYGNWRGASSGPGISTPYMPASIGTKTFSASNRYGFLWVPATATARGYAKWFYDGSQVGSTVVWDQYSAALSPVPEFGSSAFSVIDSRHMALILGTSNTNLPMKITSVAVWQKSAANNVSY